MNKPAEKPLEVAEVPQVSEEEASVAAADQAHAASPHPEKQEPSPAPAVKAPVILHPRFNEVARAAAPKKKESIFNALHLPILKDDIFLGILALTVLNAFIYLYYATTQQPVLDLKEANLVVRERLGRDTDFLAPVTDFTNVHGSFVTPENTEFETSLARFKSKLSKLGIDSSDIFFLDEFIRKNGGLYWSKRSDRAPTVYQPVAP